MIYLDYAAATPLGRVAREAMEPYFSDEFFNPSAPYLPARETRAKYEAAKGEIAHLIGAKGADLVMTGGATEAISLAFTAISDSSQVLYLATEHDSVKNTAKKFIHREIAVDKNGVIDLEDFEQKLTGKVAFVSIALASSELGVVQPFAKIAEIIKRERQKRLESGKRTPLYFHTDASQALGLLEVNVARLGVDLLTLNSGKVYGLKGVGALYVGRGVTLRPISVGGGQEGGLRSGTENVPGVVGFAAAAKEAHEHLASNRKKYGELKKIFREELTRACAEIEIEPVFLGGAKHQLANYCPVSLPGVDAERMIFKLEERGIYVSTGAACAASKGKKSESLKAIGLSDEEILGSLRVTMGAGNDEEQIRTAAREIAKAAGEVARESVDGSEDVGDAEVGAKIGAKVGEGKKVFVGMSGGVDSSVAAALLKEQGYDVVGVYMKNWSRDLPGMKCPWAEDLADAKRVATKLGIPFKVFDFEDEYRRKVVDYMIDEFKLGRTPNPDIVCNQEVKFKLFYEVALENGADFIATGHYAKTFENKLLRAEDSNKDQTYFLYRISNEAIARTIFPVGGMMKPEVKKLAEEFGFANAYKKESMGVCFVGEVGIKDFLRQYVDARPGAIIDVNSGHEVGRHEGAIFYTIGQRKGLDVGGGLPYYVTGKDMEKNEVYVSRDLNNAGLWTKELKLRDVILRDDDDEIKVRLRHRGELISAELEMMSENAVVLRFSEEVRRPAAGQSAVIYGGEEFEVCLGGGIIY